MALPDGLTQQVTNTLDAVSTVTGARQVGKLAGKATNYLADHAAQFVSGIIILVVGIVVTGWIARVLSRLLERRKLEPPERLLIVVVARIVMLGLTIMVVSDICGYSIGAVLTGLGVLAVGVGFALQGLLGNIIAGMTLIFTKPFLVGEYIEILGAQGLVTHIDIISTTLIQIDHSKVVIPNHKIVGEVLHNYGKTRQLSLSIGVGYQTDLPKAMELTMRILGQSKHVLSKPAPIVAVGALRDSAIALSIKSWVKATDYELAEGELNEAIVHSFRQNQIEIPFPRRDIHVIQTSTTPPALSP